MKLRKTSVTILALIAIIAVLGSALAIIYITRLVSWTANIKVIGNFRVYSDITCTTELTSFDFPEFDIFGQDAEATKTIYFKNIGNKPIHVYWNLTDLTVFQPNTGGGYQRSTPIMWQLLIYYGDIEPSNIRLMQRQCTYPPDATHILSFMLSTATIEHCTLRLIAYNSTQTDSVSFTSQFYGEDA